MPLALEDRSKVVAIPLLQGDPGERGREWQGMLPNAKVFVGLSVLQVLGLYADHGPDTEQEQETAGHADIERQASQLLPLDVLAVADRWRGDGQRRLPRRLR